MSDVSSTSSRPTSPIPGHIPAARPYRFTWDPSDRKPGPESVSGTTEGRGVDDFSGPHPLAFLSTANASLTLPTEWSSSRTGFHAISTALNNPHKRQAPPKAHSTLPSVPPAELPRVRRKDFDSYLNAIAPEWERYGSTLRLSQEGLAQLGNNDDEDTPRNSMSGDQPSTQLPLSLQRRNMPSLDSVPPVFFQKEFNPGDPNTFANLTEQDRATDDTFADPLSPSHSVPLIDRFSHYADTVEQHLVREIFIRSPSFFAALTNLRDLQSESERCLNRIAKLRKELQDVDNNSAKRGLEMVRKETKMANLGKVRDGVRMIGEVVEMTGVAKSLVNAGQWGEALGVIESIERLWDSNSCPPPTESVDGPLRTSSLGHSVPPNASQPLTEEDDEGREIQRNRGEPQSPRPPLSQFNLPLSSLHAFASLPSHLRQLTMEIATSLSNELVSVLRNDLEIRINNDSQPSLDADQSLKQSLKPLLLNLVRTKGLKEGMLSWREVIMVEVRAAVRKIIPGFETDDDDNRKSTESAAKAGLGNYLRGMTHMDFVVLIQKVYRNLFNAVNGLQTQGNLIVEILTSLGSELNQNITNIPAVQEDLSDIVFTTAELSNTQAAKIISYRAEQHALVELADFLTFFNDSWSFVINCETICRRMIVGLRGTIVGQAKLFLQAFHQTRISQSAKLVEDELWNPAEITPGLQHIADVLVDSAVRDPPELVIRSDDTIFSPRPTNSQPPSPQSDGATPTASFQTAVTNGIATALAPAAKAASSKHLQIEARSYFAVTATTEVLSLLLDYLRVIVNLSMLTTDTMSRVIEFLKAFNSRTCQVVLGAGAMRSAGLKNITAKHLALASQSLSIVFELIPYIRETFRRHLSQKQAVMLIEFDKLKRDFQEHQNEIHSKLIAIMGDRLNAHIKSFKAVDWTTPNPGRVNDYMEILVKETATLYKVLSRYLSAPVVEYVMTQVFAAINHRLSEEYTALELPHQEAKDRLLADARHLHEKLSVLKDVGAPTEMLETLVSEKIIGHGGKLDSTHQGGIPFNGTSNQGLARSNTLTTNQRLKGLMSGKRPSFLMSAEKPLPQPSQTPPPPPPASDKPRSPIPSQNLTANRIYGNSSFTDHFGSVSQVNLPETSNSSTGRAIEGSSDATSINKPNSGGGGGGIAQQSIVENCH